ncbi:hypothetical protein EV426DRAFT_624702 [Tirmania nivea]|nr:hypothetical protein EV426DRAFT_624702 [Tirmania nivea]
MGRIAPSLLADLVDELLRGLGLLACLLVAVFVGLRVPDAKLHCAGAGVGFSGIMVGHAGVVLVELVLCSRNGSSATVYICRGLEFVMPA